MSFFVGNLLQVELCQESRNKRREEKITLGAQRGTENMNLAVSLIHSHLFIHSFKCLLFGSICLGALEHKDLEAIDAMAISVIKEMTVCITDLSVTRQRR